MRKAGPPKEEGTNANSMLAVRAKEINGLRALLRTIMQLSSENPHYSSMSLPYFRYRKRSDLRSFG
jgi:hypothetical protein